MVGGLGGAPGAEECKKRRERIRRIVERVYDRTRLLHCCNPKDLAVALGLRVMPANVERAYIAEGVLRFPNRAQLPRCGKSIYLALARYILVIFGEDSSPETVEIAAMELALPLSVARMCRLRDLAKTQPHYPLTELENALMTVDGSRVMQKIPVGI